MRFVNVLSLALLTTTACGSSSGLPASAPVSGVIDVPQVAPEAAATPPVRVRVLDASGNPVSGTPAPVVGTLSKTALADESKLTLRADVRDLVLAD